MYSYSYLNTAKSIISAYKGDVPFAAWLKEFFKKDKKFGSRDRKQIGHLCYCYFRAARALSHLNLEQQIIWSLFLCSSEQNKLLEGLSKELNGIVQLLLDEKITKAKEVGFDLQHIFPWQAELSDEISHSDFCKSFLVQPDLFLRIRPGKEQRVSAALQFASISFQSEGPSCIRLSNTTKVDEVITLDKDAVVQDLNSQKTLDKLDELISKEKKIKAWDCCAASGGKSLLFHDLFPNATILATDIRSSILHNLQKRFGRAGIKDYRSQVHDVSQHLLKENFDVVICDAPCSGSGTWSRTPEQLIFFKEDKIDYYSNLQKKIALNASKSVKQGGYFVYITCSVFKKENEEVVSFIQQQTGLKHIESRYLKGYHQKADTLFTALFDS
jgi:16S rRNA (cytosine967-C5)-methyltransferase